ncbi:hypothetical protein NW760_004299 [Fusarium oxysporum]|nr:hypothetical protein NW769_014548 [Fusarium oxysporum]KAJ4234798.1 hypothetical protein NW760_004299 [Fusarium oxysporum]
MEKWWNELCEAQVKQLPLLPNPRPRALTPSLTPGDEVISNLAPRPLYQESCSWFKVPPNIRKDILRLAFGDTHLHSYMNRGYPDVPPEPDSKFHCRVVTEPENWGFLRFPVTDESQAELWQWWGSRCHRYPPSVAKAQGPMTHGGSKGPWIDFCRNGGDPDICEAWREDEGPSACNIGVIADQDYDNMDKRHLKSIFDLLSPSKFPALRRLHIWFAKDRTAWLSVHGIEAYEKVIFEHLDSFVQFRRDLQECAFALPRCFFKRKYAAARGVTTDETEESRHSLQDYSYRQVWRDLHGDMTVVQLPYVDSYPRAPYHIPQGMITLLDIGFLKHLTTICWFIALPVLLLHVYV